MTSRKLAKTLMVQGTSSSVGKSLLVTALCRIFRDHGVHVAPFKAQNMALNAAVTLDGLEIGRAQAVQAQAARLMPRVEMNPILLKPEGDQGSQIILMGMPAGHVSARSYFADHDRSALKEAIAASLHTLRSEHDLVLIEGAGSPAEVNLRPYDIVNMHVAQLADAPVLLVGDIERGGVFASLLGTLDLLAPDERARVAGLIVNKFRGDASLFTSGVEFLKERSGKPVLGVVPYVRALRIADEDSQSLDLRGHAQSDDPNLVDIVVLRTPHMSNHDDVLALEHEPGVRVRFVQRADDVLDPDLLIVAGSKSTVQDLAWLRAQGFDSLLTRRAASGGYVLGICGGFQMLGQRIDDPHAVESSQTRVPALGLLPVRTHFEQRKLTTLVRAQRTPHATTAFLSAALREQDLLDGYEIHHGAIHYDDPSAALFSLARLADGSQALDGVCNPRGNVVGTMLHGVLDDDQLRAGLLAILRQRRGLPAPLAPREQWLDEYDRLATVVSSALDMRALQRIVGL